MATDFNLAEIFAPLPANIRVELLAHARVPRAVAMRALDIEDDDTFKNVVDANPDLVHKLAGEKRAKYLTTVIARLLSPARCAAPVEGSKSGGSASGHCAKGGGQPKRKRTL